MPPHEDRMPSSQVARFTDLHDVSPDDVTHLRELLQHLRSLHETTMPPTVWNQMYHALEHFPDQIALYGPPHTTWMYHMESMFGHLTRTLRSRSEPTPNVLQSWLVTQGIQSAQATLKGNNMPYTPLQDGMYTQHGCFVQYMRRGYHGT